MTETVARPPAPPLVVRFGAFGDMVLLEPMLNVLRQRYGQPCELVSSGPWTQPLMRYVDSVRTTRILYSRSGPYLLNPDQWRLVRWLRLRPPGPVYVCETDAKTHALLRRGGCAPEWICSRRDFPVRPGEHYIQRYHRLAAATPAAWRGAPPAAAPERAPPARLSLGAGDQEDCARWLERRGLAQRPVVLVQPGNKRTMRWWAPAARGSNIKYWPESRWAQLIRGIRTSLPQAAVLVCGSPQESRLADAIVALSGDGAYSVTRELPIARLLALQAQAHSMISVDTGPAHSAMALGCPLVVMYATTDTSMYAPYLAEADTRLLTSSGDSADQPLLSISVEQVLTAWRGLAPGSRQRT